MTVLAGSVMEWLNGVSPVVVLADLSNRNKSFQVLIGLVWVDVVEGAAVSRVAVWSGEINRHLQNNTSVNVKSQNNII